MSPPLPSSLPPSSPPSTSSQYPYPASPDSFSIHDPFGFFAVERKLKAQRKVLSRDANQAKSRLPLIDISLKPVTPPTPRKKHDKTRNFRSPTPTLDGSESTPSTPSPSKNPIRKGKAKVTDGEGDLFSQNELDHDVIGASSTIAVRTQTSQRKSRRQASVSTETKSTRDTVPRVRPIRRATVARRKVGKSKNVDNDEHEKHVKKRGNVAGELRTVAAVRSHRVKGEIKGVGRAPESYDQEEKWERERQERLEYFRKLEGYQIAKENVYVI